MSTNDAPRSSEEADALVLGGGAAGLMAARTLAEAGRRVLLLEAQPRLGGRILTRHDAGFKHPVELGPEFIHGRPEVTWRLVREAGLTAYDVTRDFWQRRAGRLVRLDDLWAEMAPVMDRLAVWAEDAGEDLPFADFLSRHAAGSVLAEARRTACLFAEGFEAADPERVSSRALAREWQGGGAQPQFRLTEGYGALVDFLAERARAAGAMLCTGTPVTAVRWRAGRVKAESEGRTFAARRLIATLPVGLWQMEAGAEGGVRFAPALPEKRAAARRLGAGAVVKAVLRFRTAFWEEEEVGSADLADLGFVHAPEAAFPSWWTALPLRQPVLTAWAGGTGAHRLAGRGEAALVDEALRTLADLFEIKTEDLRARLDAAHVHDWAADPWARGAYSYDAVGSEGAREALAAPVAGTLFFAGEATVTGGPYATVAGALQSGERAASEALQAAAPLDLLSPSTSPRR